VSPPEFDGDDPPEPGVGAAEEEVDEDPSGEDSDGGEDSDLDADDTRLQHGGEKTTENNKAVKKEASAKRLREWRAKVKASPLGQVRR
jgi:hypothetical protein